MTRTSKKNANNEINNTTVMEEKTMDKKAFDMEATLAAFGNSKVWVEHADKNELKVGEQVLVKEKYVNKEGSKTKYTFELVCKKTGKKGGTFFTFTKFFTNDDLKVGDVKFVLNTGKQWDEEYISKNAKVEDCNITLKNGAVFTKKINTSRAYRAIGLILG